MALSSGDVAIEEQLLNYLREHQKNLVINKISLEVPVLQKQARDHADKTENITTVFDIDKHAVSIFIDKTFNDGIEELEFDPLLKKPVTYYGIQESTNGSFVYYFLLAIIIVYLTSLIDT